MDKSGIVINGLIGPKLIRDFFTTGQFTKKKFNTLLNFGKKTIKIVKIPTKN